MSRRRSYFNSESFVYLEREIKLNAEGKFTCPEYGITRDTLQEVKDAIKERHVKREKLPKVDVIFQDSYNHGTWLRGTTTGAPVGYRDHEVWVTWPRETKRYGRSSVERKQIYRTSCYPATPENEAVISQLKALTDQIEALQKSYNETKELLTSLPPEVGSIE